MKSLARILLFLAALAYGAMPTTGMAAMAMPMVHATDTAGEAAVPASLTKAVADLDCPHSATEMTVADIDHGSASHSTSTKMIWHCAACPMLPVALSLSDSGKPARAAEAATLSPRLVSQTAAPLTPPPRS
ncbi:hypothetical protein [Rhizobium sp. 'Codium 1']|uniref:hypothetical protein n=1 Tax=Rhizobium sp. 'Codium 1' TaxID=2940484 RepID=UPI001E2A0EB5|nr:hypothetical protein [Rhizobium sp. 'Codium 1']MCC8931225.1 hypothetical protein [Rhizobium sp. 'Codium 1']